MIHKFPGRCIAHGYRPWNNWTFAKKIKHHGIRITGALFQEDINLSHAVLDHDLQLEKCRFEKEVNLSGVISDHGISLAESFVGGELTLAGARIKGSLVLDKGIFGKTSMVKIRVDGQVSIKEAVFQLQPDFCTLSTNAKSRLADERYTVFDLMSGEISGQFILDKTCFAIEDN